MQQVHGLLKRMELKGTNGEMKSCDERAIERKARERNEEIGHLDNDDGINCPICHNKGMVYVTDPEDDFMLSVKDCECMQRRNMIRNAKRSGFGSLLDYRVNDYKVEYDWQKAIKSKAAEYISNDHNEWFCMFGQSGVGKTMICSAIAKTFLDKGYGVNYITWNSLIKEVKQNMFEDNKTLYKYQTTEILYIDDFFKGRRTELDTTIAFDLLNYRYNANLTTLITSEYTLSEILEIDQAVGSRIKQSCGNYCIIIEKDSKKNYRLK